MKTVWHPCRNKTLQCKVCSENWIYIRVLSMAVKIVHLCVTTCFTIYHARSTAWIWKGVYYLFLSLLLQAQHIFLVKCINRTSILYEEMFVFMRFFPHWVFSEKLFRLVAPRLRKSYLALISAHVWIDPSLAL